MDEKRIEELERRIDEMEGRRTPAERSRAAVKSIVPPETRQHLRTAGREQLLAARSFLDHWIGRLRDEPEKPESGRENIRID